VYRFFCTEVIAQLGYLESDHHGYYEQQEHFEKSQKYSSQ
jgi:hypothetical protein